METGSVGGVDGIKDLPCVTASEIKIAEDAPTAIRLLQRTDHLDCAEVLGLGPYLKEE